MRPPRRGELVWAAWLASSIVTFAALESHALRGGPIATRTFPTLSQCLCRWMGLYPASRRGAASVIAFGAGWLWLTVHLVRYEADVQRVLQLMEEAR